MIILGNAQIGQMTEIHDNKVANVTIGSTEAKQRPTVPMEEAEEVSCEVVPEAQEQPTEEEPTSPPTPKAITRQNLLFSKEKHAIHFLKQAGFLDKNYEFHSEDAAKNNSNLRYLTTAQRVMTVNTMNMLCNQRKEYIQELCKDLWRMPANNHTLSSYLSKYKDSKEGQAFQQELDKILLPLNKKAR